MRAKPIWTIQSLLTCFILNGILVGGVFYLARFILQGLHRWVDPFLKAGAEEVPEAISQAFVNLDAFLNQIQLYLTPVVFGFGALITLILWVLILAEGRGFARRAALEAAPAGAAPREARPAKAQTPPAPVPRAAPPSPQPAVQILSILQRDGRLVDFLQEDLSLYEDAQIGAAVRSIHQGCKEVLAQYVQLEPVFEEGEGTEVTVPPDFDARAIRLTGNVSGEPPFRGVLRHRGWRVARIELPQVTTDQTKDWIVAPAEVEVEGQ